MDLLNQYLSLRAQALTATRAEQQQRSIEHAAIVSGVHRTLKPYAEALLEARYLGDYGQAVPLTDVEKSGLFDPLGLKLKLGHKHSPETLYLRVPECINGRPMDKAQLVLMRIHPYTDQVIAEYHPHTNPLVMVSAFIGVVVEHFHPDHVADVVPSFTAKQAKTDVTTRRVLLRLLDTLGMIGFGSCAPIEGADAVDNINQMLEDLKPDLAAIDIQPHVIHSVSEKGYWNGDYGWTGIDNASRYYLAPDHWPASAGMDATMLTLDGTAAADEQGAGE